MRGGETLPGRADLRRSIIVVVGVIQIHKNTFDIWVVHDTLGVEGAKVKHTLLFRRPMSRVTSPASPKVLWHFCRETENTIWRFLNDHTEL